MLTGTCKALPAWPLRVPRLVPAPGDCASATWTSPCQSIEQQPPLPSLLCLERPSIVHPYNHIRAHMCLHLHTHLHTHLGRDCGLESRSAPRSRGTRATCSRPVRLPGHIRGSGMDEAEGTLL